VWPGSSGFSAILPRICASAPPAGSNFAGPVCVLDAYLYPPARGGEAVVTYVDARRPTGEAMDRAACVAALVRR
jgi:hypothetical protein